MIVFVQHTEAEARRIQSIRTSPLVGGFQDVRHEDAASGLYRYSALVDAGKHGVESGDRSCRP